MHWKHAPIVVPETPLLSAAEVARFIGVNARTIRRWVVEREFPLPSRIGRMDRWTNYSIGVWLAYQHQAGRVGAAGGQPAAADPTPRPRRGRG
jgi:predicted DNA-binding transcriptional regulator AlpA